MSLNEDAVKELFGHLVFSHPWRNFEVKERAEKLLKELVSGSDDKPVNVGKSTGEDQSESSGE